MKTNKLVAMVVVIAIALFIALPNLSWAAENGSELYAKNCAMCHGAAAEGKPAMKAPAIKGADKAKITKTIQTDAKHASKKSLTEAQIGAIADFLKK